MTPSSEHRKPFAELVREAEIASMGLTVRQLTYWCTEGLPGPGGVRIFLEHGYTGVARVSSVGDVSRFLEQRQGLKRRVRRRMRGKVLRFTRPKAEIADSFLRGEGLTK